MQKKYEFTGETKDWYGVTLKRIRAVRDFTLKSGIRVEKGALGGWIEKEKNLSHTDSAWVSGDAMVCGDAEVYVNAMVHGNAMVYGNAEVCDYAEICGNAEVYGNAWVFGTAQVYGDAEVYGGAKICGDARVYGNARVSGDARVFGDAKVEKASDIIWFKNNWSSGRTFTYTRSNGKWDVGCFYGTGEELIKKAYADSEVSGKCYEAIVEAVEKIYKSISDPTLKGWGLRVKETLSPR